MNLPFRKCPRITLVLFLFWTICGQSCEQQQIADTEKKKGQVLSVLIQNNEFWEGTKSEFSEIFSINDKDLFCRNDTQFPYSGIIKIRSRTGTVAAMKSYSSGLRDGDFFEWHDNGKLKSKFQYSQGLRHGYFYIWTNDGGIYSRKYYQDDLEDFGRFPDQGSIESGRSLSAIELQEWEGTGLDFYQKFAGDPKRGGVLYIRETEELFTGVITALDDKGRKEALLNFVKGKYHGTISKWNEKGDLWQEGEFDRGNLVQFSIKEGEPFDGNQIIDLSEDPSMVNLLFGE